MRNDGRIDGHSITSSTSRPTAGGGRLLAKGALACVSLEQLPGGAVFLDDAERIADANTAAARIFGCRRRDLRGHALAELIPDWETLGQADGRAARRAVELGGLRANGARTTLRIWRREVTVDGVPYALVFISDCERRKALELQVRDALYGAMPGVAERRRT